MRTTGESGFTLVEVLVATFLVGIISLAVAPMMLMAVQTSAIGQEITELTVGATEQMEILRAFAFSDPGLTAGGSIVASNAGFSIDPVNGDANRYIRWQIVNDNVARKRITLVAGVRTSIFGPPREITMETFRTDLQ
jgi:prepilin-type N-terminal cleavage/methylation domain-containing protein